MAATHGAHGTHCKKGHELTPENTLWRKRDGVPIYKRCKICQYAANEVSVQRRVAKVKAEMGIE